MCICPECQERTADLVCPRDGTPTVDETLIRDTADPLLGTVLAGRFRLLEPIGQGGMGRVYVPDQITMKRRVAVKVIRPETFSDSESRLDIVFEDVPVTNGYFHVELPLPGPGAEWLEVSVDDGAG